MKNLKLTEEEIEAILAARKIKEEGEKRGKLNEQFVKILLMTEGFPTDDDSVVFMATMSAVFFKEYPDQKKKFLDLAYEITSKADE